MHSNSSFASRIKYDISEESLRKQELYRRYQKYVNTRVQNGYKDDFIQNILYEYSTLRSRFPNVDFYCRARIKSYESYRNKVNKKISEQYSGNIYDTYAKKYVIRSVDGITDESVLIDMCYAFAEFLGSCCEDFSEIAEKKKDYIATPKDTSYQSIHITKKHLEHPDLFIESQIKTQSMEDNAKFGEASHSHVYKDRKINIQRVPIYIMPIPLKDSSGNYAIYEQSFEEAFEYFFGIPYSDYEATLSSKE